MGTSGEGPERRRASLPFTDIQIDLTRLLYEKVLVLTVLSGFSLSSCVFLLAQFYHDAWLAQLAPLTLVFAAARIALVVSFSVMSRGEITVGAARRWEIAYGVSIVAFSVFMSIATLHDFACYRGGVAAMLGVAGTFAFCNGVSERLGIRPLLPIIGGLMMLGSLAVSIYLWQEPVIRWTDVVIVFYAYSYCKAINIKFAIIVEQVRSRRRFRQLAEQDPLTGLANRRFFADSLGEACRRKAGFALLCMDLDGFKDVNDTFGHAAGDALLLGVASRLRSVVRESDLVARLGGDEFAILQTPIRDADHTRGLAQRINAVLALPFEYDENEITIGTSIGITVSAAGGVDPDEALRRADHALYAVKQSGRGSFSFA